MAFGESFADGQTYHSCMRGGVPSFSSDIIGISGHVRIYSWIGEVERCKRCVGTATLSRAIECWLAFSPPSAHRPNASLIWDLDTRQVGEETVQSVASDGEKLVSCTGYISWQTGERDRRRVAQQLWHNQVVTTVRLLLSKPCVFSPHPHLERLARLDGVRLLVDPVELLKGTATRLDTVSR